MSSRIRFDVPPSSEITPKAVYMNRRAFLRVAGLCGAGAALAACGPAESGVSRYFSFSVTASRSTVSYTPSSSTRLLVAS